MGETAMEEKNGGVRRVTTLELLDAATWREIDSDGPQPPAAFLHALSCLPGRRFLIVPRRPQLMRSLWCAQARVYVVRHENVEVNGIEDAVQH